jgi:nucleotide-binding universal stress UspA family protein
MKILVGYRGANVGKDLLDLAIKHVKAFDGEVHLLTSLPGGSKTTGESIDEAKNNLAWAGNYLENKGVKHKTHLLIVGKSPGEDLIAFAREEGCDEIIIGIKSRSKVGKILFGSTAQYVILKATCPVVSVR